MATFTTVAQVIITLSAVLVALSTIFGLMGKPLIFFKKRAKKAEEEKTKKLVESVTKEVAQKLAPDFDEIKQQNIEQYEEIRILNSSSKDMLRKHILDIYYKYKSTRAIPETERKMLDDFFADYTAEHGNSYIARKYDIMCRWDIIPDD